MSELKTFQFEDIPVEYDGVRVERGNIKEVTDWLKAGYVGTDHDIDSDRISWTIKRYDSTKASAPTLDLRVEEGDYILKVRGEYRGTKRDVQVVPKAVLHTYFRYPGTVN